MSTPLSSTRTTLDLTLPADWHRVAVTGVPLAAARDAGDGLRPNVTVTVVAHATAWTLTDEMAVVDDALLALHASDIAVLLPPDLELPRGGASAGRLVRHRDAQVGRLLQVLVVVLVPNGDVTEVVHVVGTVADPPMPGEEDALREVMTTIHIALRPVDA